MMGKEFWATLKQAYAPHPSTLQQSRPAVQRENEAHDGDEGEFLPL